MAKRGRKSGASLGVIVTSLPQRMPPPNLTEAQARIWRRVVGAKPVGYFDAATGPLLEAYCGAVASADVVSGMVDRFDMSEIAEPDGLRQFTRLLGVRDRLTRQILALARSLRLTVQSTRRADAAENRASPQGARRPWEIGSEGADEPA